EKAFVQTPIGWMELQASLEGLTSVKRVEGPIKPGPIYNDLLQRAKKQLEAYFAGELKRFNLPLDWSGAPAFNRSVWEIVKEIPYGHTTTYSAIAEQLENPKAVRAVGLANKYNPIAIIVPCHRVIAKNGDLQGYFYGLDIKRQLLELENPMAFARQGSLF
ncbi:MAG: methylated-DNA--[protein]-cysteine S-methyltransferase, partial [Phaeodactylibacter sp.]|nr:methylated-DNA--[protein]-cysteine S-methyltransferase [Phaeodactylibacter sp.]